METLWSDFWWVVILLVLIVAGGGIQWSRRKR